MYPNETICLLSTTILLSLQDTSGLLKSSVHRIECNKPDNEMPEPTLQDLERTGMADLYNQMNHLIDTPDVGPDASFIIDRVSFVQKMNSPEMKPKDVDFDLFVPYGPDTLFIYSDGTYTTKGSRYMTSHSKPISEILVDNGSILSRLKIKMYKFLHSDYKNYIKFTLDLVEYTVVCISILLYTFIVGVTTAVVFYIISLAAKGTVVYILDKIRKRPKDSDTKINGVGVPVAPKSEETTKSAKLECKICYTKRKNVVCVPCGHLYMCVSCSRDCALSKKTTCACCYKDVIMYVRVFEQ